MAARTAFIANFKKEFLATYGAQIEPRWEKGLPEKLKPIRPAGIIIEASIKANVHPQFGCLDESVFHRGLIFSSSFCHPDPGQTQASGPENPVTPDHGVTN